VDAGGASCGWERWWRLRSGAARVVGRRCSDSEMDKWPPRGFTVFQIIQNWLKLVKSKWIPYGASKIPKFCMVLDWDIQNIFLNCVVFKFPIEFMIKFLEQIQYLNLL
jgi:hypothetical protein